MFWINEVLCSINDFSSVSQLPPTLLQWQINGLISYKIMSEPQNGMQHCNMIELRKRNFGTKHFFFFINYILDMHVKSYLLAVWCQKQN